MKKKFYKSCVALMLTMVMIFGGVHFNALTSVRVASAAVVNPIEPNLVINVTLSAPSTHMTIGHTMQLSCSSSPTNLTKLYSSSNTTIATVDSNGIVTAHTAGTATITVLCNNPTVGFPATDSVTITVHESTGIKDNTAYYIMNALSGRLLSLEISSDADKTNVYTRPRSTTNMSQWRTRSISGGWYNLESVHSPTEKCLDVTGNNVDIYTNTGGSYLKFTIDRVESGTYQGMYLIRYNKNSYVTQDSNYNVCITSTPTAGSYWSFMSVNKYYADIFGFNYGNAGNSNMINSTTHFAKFETTMDNLGYIGATHVNTTAMFAYDFLKASDIFVYVGHAEAGRLSFYSAPNHLEGRIVAHENMQLEGDNQNFISDMSDNMLAKAKCVLYLGCNSGSGYQVGGTTYNLVDETFNKGAHFVFGFTQIVYNTDVDDFLEGFLDELATPYKTINDCIDAANKKVLEDSNNTEELSYYCRGDGNQYLH